MVDIQFFSNSVKVVDSYKVKTKKEIKQYIIQIINDDRCPKEVLERKQISLIREWRAHNNLYKFGLFKTHTKDVDLGYEPLWRRICYFFLSF